MTLAVWTGWGAVSSSPDGVAVVVAGSDLGAGTTLSDGDVEVVTFRDGSVPDGVLVHREVTGRVLASPLRRGEPVTDARLLAPGLTAQVQGRSVVPVRLEDGAVASLLRVGDVVDLIRVDARTGGHQALSRGARVVSVVPSDGGQPAGPLLAMAVPNEDADDVAAAGSSGGVQVILPPAS